MLWGGILTTYKFKKELYSKIALLKAAYSFTDKAYIHLDADDEFFTEVLGKLICVLKENDVDLVLTDVFSHDPDGNITRDTRFLETYLKLY